MVNVNDVFDRKVSTGWKTGHADVVRFYCDGGTMTWGFPFHGLAALHHNDKGLFLHFHGATVNITGEKLEAFLDEFVLHNVISVKADGADIASVTVNLAGQEQD